MVGENIAIVGGFCSGKSTLADVLVRGYGYTRVSFAGRLKQVAADIYNGGVPIDKNGSYPVCRLDGYRESISGRRILQELGQSVKSLDREVWIKWMLSDIKRGVYGPAPYVIDDCRFPYEAEALDREGFVVAKLDTDLLTRMQRYEAQYGRLPSAAELTHPSEMEVEDIVPFMVLDGSQSPAQIAEDLFRVLELSD